MATVILQDHRSLYLENILNTFTGMTPKNLYLGIGRIAAWPNEASPPIPVNTLDEKSNFFTDIVAAQLVTPATIAPIVRRIDWAVGVMYDAFDVNSDASFTSDFYVRNTENNVYKVASKVPASVTANEPLGTGSGAVIDTVDGYTWEFLYNISGTLEALVTNNWMPVTYASTITAEQTADGDVGAFRTLGTNHMLIESQVSDPLISETIVYRQIALLVDITDNLDVLLTGSAVLAVDIKESGYMLHIENRKPIARSAGQTETFQTILKIY